jgi:uncharacterized protein involved in exopolysaccharide biosynthesis
LDSIDVARNADVVRNADVARNADGGATPLGEIGGILSRRKWQILIVFLLTVAVVATVTFRMPKQYEARMKILVKNDRANPVVSAGVNAQPSAPGEVSETEVNTEIELLNNNDLLQQVVTASDLAKLETIPETYSGDRRQLALLKAVGRLQHDLKISPVRRADIIEVNYTAGDPHQVATVLRQLAASYLEVHLRIHGSQGTHQFFSSQAARYQSELKDAEARLADFRAKNDIVLFEQQKEEIVRRAAESGSMLLAAEAGIREYTRRIDDARSRVGTAQARVVTQNRTLSNQSSVERLSTMLVELQNRRTQLLAKYRPDDRLVLEVSQEIADTQAALEKAKSLTGSDQVTDINPVHQTLELEIVKGQAELAGIEARRQALIQQTSNYHLQLNRLGGSTTKYEDLMRSRKEAEDNYLLYARKMEEARIADSLDQQKIANVTIAENPVEPLLPSKPDVPVNLALGTLLAGFLSLGVAFSAEYLQKPFPRVELNTQIGGRAMDTRLFLEIIELPTDLEALTGLPVLAIRKRG